MVQSQMAGEGRTVSIAAMCQWFGLPRSTFYYQPKKPKPPVMDEALTKQIRRVIDENPVYGLRRITAIVGRELGRRINRKKVHRILKLNGWQIWQKPQGKRPRVTGWTSRVERPNERWAVDTTHIFCGRDGWCHLTAVLDCCDRMIVGWRLSKSGVATVAAAALEEALRARNIEPGNHELTVRSDNGLVFGAKPFVAVVNRYQLGQEYITPYSPEQNGMIERFFASLKAECVWLHRFRDRDHAFEVVAEWIDTYHSKRPHSALGYLTPSEYRERLAA